jgi:XapX domain-containing protein
MFESWLALVKASAAGLLVGFLFAAIRLPIPAPPKLEGVVGIAAIFLGYWVYRWLFMPS